MLKFFSLLLAAVVLLPAAANANEYTHVAITNGTNYFIYVDSYEHYGRVQHWGLLPPGHREVIEAKHPGMKFFTDIYVYVKKTRNASEDNTLCTVKKTFGNTTGKPALEEHVHFNGKVCTIDPA